jgi:hypothetical protein
MRLTAAALAATVALLAACTGEEAPRWSRSAVSVPGEVVTLTAMDDGLLVGSYAASEPVRPRLSLVRGGRVATVPAIPSPGYGAEARWTAVAADGSSLAAVGGARGGAHANVRWTEWTGDLEGVRDVPQSFWTFGGHEAGDVVGVAYLDGAPVIVGGWASPTTGFDVATYELDGQRWVRRSPAGPALASTRSELVTGSAVAARPRELVVVGSAERLVAELPVTAVAWTGRRSGPKIAWTRLDLPGPAPAEARAVSCGGGECLVVGRVRGHLATWLLRDGSPRLVEVQEVPVGDTDVVLAPARSAQHWYVVVRSGSGGHGLVGDGDGTGWREDALPSGAPVAVAATPDGVWLATSAHGHSTLLTAAEDDR